MKVFIAGANSDIGLATSEKYLNNCWEVVAHFRKSPSKLLDLQLRFPGKIKLLNADFFDEDNITQLLTLNEKALIECDSLINCVGSAMPVEFDDIKTSDLIEHFKINAIPNIILAQFFSKLMLQKKWGRIVFLSSIGIKFGGGIDNYCYSASKMISEFFPAVAKKEWAKNNVFINTVRVGVIDTKFHKTFKNKSLNDRTSLIPAQRLGKPSEVAEVIYFLGSQLNKFTTCEILTVAGGE
jgi:3-oxoacyl-[acyl-carrier protein] reductase